MPEPGVRVPSLRDHERLLRHIARLDRRLDQVTLQLKELENLYRRFRNEMFAGYPGYD